MDVFDKSLDDSDQDKVMDEIEEIYALVKTQALVPVVPTKILQNIERSQLLATAHFFPLRKTKTGKVQELVQVKMSGRGTQSEE